MLSFQAIAPKCALGTNIAKYIVAGIANNISGGMKILNRYFNVGIIQQSIAYDTAENLKYIAEKVDAMMSGCHKPEMIVGVEGGIGYYTPQTIPGPITDYLCSIAKKYGIYFIPGTMYEEHPDCPEGMYYNSAPVINPQGEIIAVYRKMAPWRPTEAYTHPGREYVVFDVPEKDTKVGLMICYDSNYPEIARNLTLMGAEVIIKVTQDPEELYYLNKPVHLTRALENQTYFISVNTCGKFGNFSLYGNSMFVSPEGKILWEAGREESFYTMTLDLDIVRKSREYGTLFMDHYLKHLREYDFPNPFSGAIADAPVYRNLSPAPKNVAEYDSKVKEVGLGNIGKEQPAMSGEELEGIFSAQKSNLDEFLSSR